MFDFVRVVEGARSEIMSPRRTRLAEARRDASERYPTSPRLEAID